jgi:hypothetical protein
VQTTLEGNIIMFIAENHQEFKKIEVVLREGDIGILLWEIPLLIEVLLVEEGIFLVPLVNMED